MNENETTKVINEEGIEVDPNEKIARYAGYIRVGALVAAGIIIGGKLNKRRNDKWWNKRTLCRTSSNSYAVVQARLNELKPLMNGSKRIIMYLIEDK